MGDRVRERRVRMPHRVDVGVRRRPLGPSGARGIKGLGGPELEERDPTSPVASGARSVSAWNPSNYMTNSNLKALLDRAGACHP